MTDRWWTDYRSKHRNAVVEFPNGWSAEVVLKDGTNADSPVVGYLLWDRDGTLITEQEPYVVAPAATEAGWAQIAPMTWRPQVWPTLSAAAWAAFAIQERIDETAADD